MTVWAVGVSAVVCIVGGRADGGGDDVRYRVEITRTETAPEIDGDIDEAVWGGAAVIDDFTQVNPREGEAASERTEVRLLFDTDFLYIAVRCFDSEAGLVRATVRQRDADFGFDDYVSISVDPYDSKRNGFLFETNALGARRDALIENNDDLAFDWDGIWYAAGSVDGAGWSAEIAVPFKTLSFSPDAERWGFNVQRVIRRKLETVRWSSPYQSRGLNHVSDAGDMVGISGISQGVGLDVQAFGVFRFENDEARGKRSAAFDAGVDLFYKVTPELNFALTVNTDFAETEVDDRRVNLTRFPLFFPEKRDFFLQDTDVFSFGGIGRNPLPYFSRRIGISPGGEPLDILYGARVSGRIGEAHVGILNVQVDRTDGLESKNLTVGRVAFNILEESTVGFITTVGDPQTNGDSFLVGADFNYRNSRDFGSDVLEAHAFALQTETSDSNGDASALGGSVRYNSDDFQWNTFFTHIGPEHNPALGFSPRRGIREYGLSGRKRWRPERIRRFDIGSSVFLVTDTRDALETINLTPVDVDLEFDSGDVVGAQIDWTREELGEAFEIADGVVIEAGRHDFVRGSVFYQTSTARPLRARAEGRFGEFFDGNRFDTVGSLEWRPTALFGGRIEYEQNEVDLSGGGFIARIARLRADVAFSTDVTTSFNLQWDNVSDQAGLNARLRWIIEPGSELILVFNQGASTLDDRVEFTTSEFTVKATVTFRF